MDPSVNKITKNYDDNIEAESVLSLPKKEDEGNKMIKQS